MEYWKKQLKQSTHTENMKRAHTVRGIERGERTNHRETHIDQYKFQNGDKKREECRRMAKEDTKRNIKLNRNRTRRRDTPTKTKLNTLERSE